MHFSLNRQLGEEEGIHNDQELAFVKNKNTIIYKWVHFTIKFLTIKM